MTAFTAAAGTFSMARGTTIICAVEVPGVTSRWKAETKLIGFGAAAGDVRERRGGHD